jgi:uncharacterized protein YraI
MRVKAILAGAAMMIAIVAMPAAASAANAIANATVNFRASPNGPIMGTIPHGAPVTVLGRSGNWCQTEWRARIGWAYCRYLNVGVAEAPRYVPQPAYPYAYGYPDWYGYAYPSFSFGFGVFDRGYRYRDYRSDRGYRYRDWRPRHYTPGRWRDGDRRVVRRSPSVRDWGRAGSPRTGRRGESQRAHR